MAAAGHFLFELVKIALLSAAYSTILFLIIKLIRGNKVKNWKRLWSKIFVILYWVLFAFMFTYWGDHGLGDDYYIPIPHFQTVDQGDETPYIEIKKHGQFGIGKFSYDDKYLYAQVADKAQINGDYLVWDLENDEAKAYPANTYLAMCKTGHAISPGEFKDFNYFYDRYWSGWRLWLLP